MIDISLTDFVDFVTRSGVTKQTKVRQLKNRPPYSPATDYYKTLREGIVEMHRNQYSVALLERLCDNLPPNKRENYPAVVEAYKKFCKQKNLDWFEPCVGQWTHNDLAIRLNPELGLHIGGVPYIIKLYFKADKISKEKVGLILQLLEEEFPQQTLLGVQFGILDIQRSRLLTRDPRRPNLMPLLYGEATSLQTIWHNL